MVQPSTVLSSNSSDNTPAHNEILQHHELFKKWLRFLMLIRLNEENVNTITRYFFEQCASQPERFYQFMRFFSRHLQNEKNPDQQREIGLKYLEILSHLCERFGFFEIKKELDNICFKITHVDEYKRIDKFLVKYEKKSHELVNKIMSIFDELMKKNGYTCTIQGRYKTIYSIYRKIRKKHRDILALNDIFAFRIIVQDNSVKTCFEILNLLHDKYYPIPDFFKDYITVPKINGYQSVQTGLANIIPELDLPVEVQIRTETMDKFAERGLAAHWLYAEKKQSKIITEKEKKLVNYLSSFANRESAKNFIYCFSFDGNMFMLEKGSTMIDFAYLIHSDLGAKTKCAQINGETRPLSYVIEEGDVIQVITSEKPQVTKEWLGIAHNKNTIKKIKDQLKKYGKKTDF